MNFYWIAVRHWHGETYSTWQCWLPNAILCSTPNDASTGLWTVSVWSSTICLDLEFLTPVLWSLYQKLGVPYPLDSTAKADQWWSPGPLLSQEMISSISVVHAPTFFHTKKRPGWSSGQRCELASVGTLVRLQPKSKLFSESLTIFWIQFFWIKTIFQTNSIQKIPWLLIFIKIENIQIFRILSTNDMWIEFDKLIR